MPKTLWYPSRISCRTMKVWKNVGLRDKTGSASFGTYLDESENVKNSSYEQEKNGKNEFIKRNFKKEEKRENDCGYRASHSRIKKSRLYSRRNTSAGRALEGKRFVFLLFQVRRRYLCWNVGELPNLKRLKWEFLCCIHKDNYCFCVFFPIFSNNRMCRA